MKEFQISGRQKSVLFGFMGLGLLCMIITFIIDDAYQPRFWSNFLINSVFFTGISFIALFILCAKAIAYSGWQTVFKRLWEAYSMFLIVGLVLMLIVIIGIFGGFHHLYHWTDEHSLQTDKILAGKAGFLNPFIYTLFTIVIVGVWYFFARKVRSLSISEDHNPGMTFDIHRKIKKYSAAFLPIGGFTSAAVIWLWVMSVDAHWYSTLFAWYATASWLVSMVALTILILAYLKSLGYFQNVTNEHFHDLGKYVFGFSIFWTYLWFSQYMLIWYGNVGEETIYFKMRQTQYPALFYGILIMNFVLPFFILLRNDTKRKMGTMIATSIIVLIGHWLDFFLMIKPGVLHTYHEVAGGHGESHSTLTNGELNARLVADAAHGAEHASSFQMGFTIPGFLEFGTFLGFLALFLYFTFIQLNKANLVPKGDPYIGESLHHHV
ncbi:hypothetical protein [Membranihabitans maritimus]|uniref:hypothetical protein n=1 Tax=Membranihabitans maritimus TaxID=2904244 RepID=UPI001F387868|nr:hypothetical protein [Membranihabitans maritimus]